MRIPWFTALALLALLSNLSRADELREMPVGPLVEERYRDSDLALVVPERLELTCKSGPRDPWHFSFAGFQTKWDGPIEIEVSGSGGYETHDVFSIAALSLDFATKGGWKQRSLLGLGLIQGQRGVHPPGWGVGTQGKTVTRENLAAPEKKPQKITIDPSKYAPPGWDGRLWIGLLLHNAGPGKWITVRITNAQPPGGKVAAEPEEAKKWTLLRDHQQAFLQYALGELTAAPAGAAAGAGEGVAEEMKPYVASGLESSSLSSDGLANQIKRVLGHYDKTPPGAEGFIKLAESYFESTHHHTAVVSVADKLNALLKSWRDGGEFGKGLGCIIRIATNVEKVGLADVESGRVVGLTAEPIHISAARREHEGFQVVLTPLPGAKANVSLSISDLTGPAGAIAADNVTINPVGYVRIFPGQPRQRLAPDPLLLGAIPPLTPGENQPVWVSVHVPETAQAGEYRGAVAIRAPDAPPLEIPLVLKVRDFEIPKKISLRSSFWMFRDQLNRFYHLREVNLDDYFKWIDFALEHRVNPIDVYEGHCEPLLDISLPKQTWGAGEISVGKPNLKPNFTKWDKYIDRMVAGGANTIHLGTSHHFGSFFADKPKVSGTPQQIKKLEQAIKVMEEHYRKKGVFDMHYLQLRDETSEPDAVNVYRSSHQDLPGVKLLLTVPSAEARPMVGIPCPQTPGFDAAWRDEVKAKNGEYWWYVCLSPEDPYANLFIFQSGAQHRALFWQTWSNQVDGLLYWGLNYWSGYDFKWPASVKQQTTRIAAEDSPPVGAVTEHPGDGFSMYPGPTPAQPASSIRLEAMRDGEEDYEYFRLLDSLIAKAESSGQKDPAVTDARRVREDAKKLVASLTDYDKNGAPYLAIRERVGDAIEKLIKP